MSDSGSQKGNPVLGTIKRGSLTPLEQGSVTITSPFSGMEASLAKLQTGQLLHLALSVLVASLIVTTLIVTIVKGGTPNYSELLPLLNDVSSTGIAVPVIQALSEVQTHSRDDPDFFHFPCSVRPFKEDLTTQGIEPNPGPVTMPSLQPRKKSSGQKKKGMNSRPTNKIVLTNAPPIQRVQLQNRSRRPMNFMSGHAWNPRSEMIGYFQTLCDAERYPPVRLGGETMVPTALTTLHQVFQFTATTTAMSIVVHPRIWNPVQVSNTASSPYNYFGSGSYAYPSVGTLQNLAAAARVVSAKVKVYSTSSATSDQGSLTCGLCPTDPGSFSNAGSQFNSEITPNTAQAAPVPYNLTSTGGYPVATTIQSASITVPCTQGVNEFAAEDWTDTVPLKDGASIFWLPEDPSSLTFLSTRIRQDTLQQAGTAANPVGVVVSSTQIVDPFFCIGLSGLSTTSTFSVEVYLNLEYTVTSGASNVIQTRTGSMSSVEQFSIAKRVGGNLTSYVEPDPEASLCDKLQEVGKSVLKGGINRASEFLFGSSDVGQKVNNLLF